MVGWPQQQQQLPTQPQPQPLQPQQPQPPLPQQPQPQPQQPQQPQQPPQPPQPQQQPPQPPQQQPPQMVGLIGSKLRTLLAFFKRHKTVGKDAGGQSPPLASIGLSTLPQTRKWKWTLCSGCAILPDPPQKKTPPCD